MKLIIAGSRNLDPNTAYEYINEMCFKLRPLEIVSGNSGNVDEAGNLYAFNIGHKLTQFNPDWKLLGKAAGPIRNRKMAEYADELLLIWDGESPGSKSMKHEMEKLGKPIHEIICKR